MAWQHAVIAAALVGSAVAASPIASQTISLRKAAPSRTLRHTDAPGYTPVLRMRGGKKRKVAVCERSLAPRCLVHACCVSSLHPRAVAGKFAPQFACGHETLTCRRVRLGSADGHSPRTPLCTLCRLSDGKSSTSSRTRSLQRTRPRGSVPCKWCGTARCSSASSQIPSRAQRCGCTGGSPTAPGHSALLSRARPSCCAAEHHVLPQHHGASSPSFHAPLSCCCLLPSPMHLRLCRTSHHCHLRRAPSTRHPFLHVSAP